MECNTTGGGGVYFLRVVRESKGRGEHFLGFRRGPLPLQGSTNLLQSVRDKNDKNRKVHQNTTVLDMNCIKLEF
jgi:hypothetical protein